jgi:hypothetical protein
MQYMRTQLLNNNVVVLEPEFLIRRPDETFQNFIERASFSFVKYFLNLKHINEIDKAIKYCEKINKWGYGLSAEYALTQDEFDFSLFVFSGFYVRQINYVRCEDIVYQRLSLIHPDFNGIAGHIYLSVNLNPLQKLNRFFNSFNY